MKKLLLILLTLLPISAFTQSRVVKMNDMPAEDNKGVRVEENIEGSTRTFRTFPTKASEEFYKFKPLNPDGNVRCTPEMLVMSAEREGKQWLIISLVLNSYHDKEIGMTKGAKVLFKFENDSVSELTNSKSHRDAVNWQLQNVGIQASIRVDFILAAAPIEEAQNGELFNKLKNTPIRKMRIAFDNDIRDFELSDNPIGEFITRSISLINDKLAKKTLRDGF